MGGPVNKLEGLDSIWNWSLFSRNIMLKVDIGSILQKHLGEVTTTLLSISGPFLVKNMWCFIFTGTPNDHI